MTQRKVSIPLLIRVKWDGVFSSAIDESGAMHNMTPFTLLLLLALLGTGCARKPAQAGTARSTAAPDASALIVTLTTTNNDAIQGPIKELQELGPAVLPQLIAAMNRLPAGGTRVRIEFAIEKIAGRDFYFGGVGWAPELRAYNINQWWRTNEFKPEK